MKQTFTWYFILLLLISVNTSCNIQLPPQLPVNVAVEEVVIQDVPQYAYVNGQTVALQSVDIPARVSGVLKEILYSKGSIVTSGQLLFTIEDDSYKISLASAQAKLDNSKAQLELADVNLTKSRQLLQQKAIADQDFQKDLSQQRQAEATVRDAQSAVDNAALQLSYTQIKAPIDGKIDAGNVAIGNLVGPGTSNVTLTKMVSIDPMGVSVPITEKDFHRFRDKSIKEGDTNQEKPVFEMRLFGSSSGESYPYRGEFTAMGNEFNRATGTMMLFGKVPNPKHEMLPNEFCRIRVLEGTLKDAVLVKSEAVGIDLNHHYVFIIDKDSIARKQVIEVSETVNDMRVVVKGLQQGDKYVTGGLASIRDGEKVNVLTVRSPLRQQAGDGEKEDK